MANIECPACGVEYPPDQIVDVQGHTLCGSCAEKFYNEQEDAIEQLSASLNNPAVCKQCGADNGNEPHEKIAGVPLCAKCRDYFRNRPYPTWVKAAFAAVLLLVIVSMVFNWRFFQAHFELQAATRAGQDKNFSEAARLLQAAANHLPEEKDLLEEANFVQGIAHMQEDHNEDALACFEKCPHLKSSPEGARIICQANVSAAFDRKDYDGFLRAAEQYAELDPNDPIGKAQVASALACKYAASGHEQFRRQAEDKLEQAKKLGEDAIREVRYEERIRHRLETREIIDGEEFMRRYPNGWKPGDKPGDKPAEKK